ncbi:DUF3145 domain-containing protein [Tessaracoccus sp. MC1865]|uniref:DUF3145 domain-containing protein n=1 Tax=Tessaracoccus sp. MC1865 TaxID=2760310 RepID=UPI001FD831DC|nr:DUF3145 domain-containing protein [Tessaracoccus sp. MC1865]
MNARHTGSQAQGMILIHSASAALCPHIEWALGSALGRRIELSWTQQPAEAGARRSEYSWAGNVGSGAVLSSTLAQIGHLRFEVTEEPTAGSDGQRYCFTPSLGAFTAQVGVHGDILVPEDRLRHALANDALGGEPLHHALDRLLGVPWDEELDVFRYAAEDSPVRWLHQVV